MEKYIFIIVSITSLVISQIIKFLVEAIKYKKINIIRLLDGSGGMPSSHSALVSSLTTTILLIYGIDSPLFGISLVFSIVVMYDAMGIRYETGKQAEVINEIAEKIKLFDVRREIIKLKEQVGHKPIEVLAGMLLGIVISIIIVNIIF